GAGCLGMATGSNVLPTLVPGAKRFTATPPEMARSRATTSARVFWTVADVSSWADLAALAGALARRVPLPRWATESHSCWLLEPLAGPVRQGGHRVGLDADHRADLGRGHAFDLGQPQHGAPPLGQCPQGLPDEVALQVGQHDLVRVAGRRGLLGDLVAQVE